MGEVTVTSGLHTQGEGTTNKQRREGYVVTSALHVAGHCCITNGSKQEARPKGVNLKVS